ncbi:MAG: hypothetical protein HKN33_04185 [Pyrinomonadaceae bacterium]|nr:hypothetical protein [Pyrinomonadaceae bacterium]
MKKLTLAAATTILTLTLFAFPVLADCGEMNSGNRCLVQNPTDGPISTSEKKESYDLPEPFVRLLRDALIKMIF